MDDNPSAFYRYLILAIAIVAASSFFIQSLP
jgi:hypothetical protein